MRNLNTKKKSINTIAINKLCHSSMTSSRASDNSFNLYLKSTSYNSLQKCDYKHNEAVKADKGVD